MTLESGRLTPASTLGVQLPISLPQSPVGKIKDNNSSRGRDRKGRE